MRIFAERKQKLYYPFGAISLILLPIICVWYFNKHNAFEELRMTRIFWYPKKVSNDFFATYNYFFELNYTDFQLTEDNAENKIQLDSARLTIRKLLQSKDTLTGVRFRFADNAEFWTFINAIDICKSEKAKTFLPNENDLIVFNVRPPRKSELSESSLHFCGGCFIDYEPDEEALKQLEIDKRNALIMRYLGVAKQYSISIVLFLLLIVLTVIKLRKLHRVKL